MKEGETVGQHWDELTTEDRLILIDLLLWATKEGMFKKWDNVHMGNLCFVNFAEAIQEVKKSADAINTGANCICVVCKTKRSEVQKLWTRFKYKLEERVK